MLPCFRPLTPAFFKFVRAEQGASETLNFRCLAMALRGCSALRACLGCRVLGGGGDAQAAGTSRPCGFRGCRSHNRSVSFRSEEATGAEDMGLCRGQNNTVLAKNDNVNLYPATWRNTTLTDFPMNISPSNEHSTSHGGSKRLPTPISLRNQRLVLEFISSYLGST